MEDVSTIHNLIAKKYGVRVKTPCTYNFSGGSSNNGLGRFKKWNEFNLGLYPIENTGMAYLLFFLG